MYILLILTFSFPSYRNNAINILLLEVLVTRYCDKIIIFKILFTYFKIFPAEDIKSLTRVMRSFILYLIKLLETSKGISDILPFHFLSKLKAPETDDFRKKKQIPNNEVTSVSCASSALCVALYNVPQLQPNELTLKRLSRIRPLVTPMGRNGDFCDGNTCQAADQLRRSPHFTKVYE